MTYYWVQDSKTGCTWALGALFRDRRNAERVCAELKAKYQNPDLHVVERTK